MILSIQVILIVVLVSILVALYLDERHKKDHRIPRARLVQVWDGSERRCFVRVQTNVTVRYNLPKEPDKVKVVKTKDISIGGICITTNEKLSCNSRLRLEIEDPDAGAPILATGEVVWAKEDMEQKNADGIRYFNLGIEFKEVLPKDKERLFAFIKGLGRAQDS